MSKTDVLITGAGPTGLLMACQLAMRHIAFQIIDKTEDHTTQSRALVIHARSLEIFGQMGIAEQLLRQGKIAKAANLLFNGKRKLRLEFSDIGTNLTDFPFLLILEQSKTEKILNDFLEKFGQRVERNTELVDFSQHPTGATAIVQSKNGELKQVDAKWLVGADGAHSRVREKLGIPFLGNTYQQSLFVLDCEVNLNFPPDEMYLSFSDETFAGFFPMTNGRCRIIGLVPDEFAGSEEITFEQINRNFSKQTQLNITLQNPEWIAKYLSHHRVVNAFHQGRCFLAGDAAHIHSPVGAQGMNTGLQDAYNLAWKLALVIEGKATEPLLDTYHQERMAIAKGLVKTTDRAFHFVTSEDQLLKVFRLQVFPFVAKLILPIAQKLTFVKKMAFTRISEIGLHYRNSILSKQDISSSFSKTKLQPGDRVPYNILRKEFTDGNHFHLLLFSKKALVEGAVEEYKEACQPYGDLIQIHQVPYYDKTKDIYQQFGIQQEGIYLIRPDSYIAYRSQSSEAEKLKSYLKSVF
jgi:2-polyprenyl-6-methoxyphenol hydroxylase-like FAD-dependent oxidoreductase